MPTTRTLPTAAAALLLAVHAAIQAAGPDPATLAKDADRFRTGVDNLQVETQVSTFNRDGSPDKARRYTVFVQAQHKSLVAVCRSVRPLPAVDAVTARPHVPGGIWID